MQLKISLKIAENIKKALSLIIIVQDLKFVKQKRPQNIYRNTKSVRFSGGDRLQSRRSPPEKVKDAGIFMFTESLIEINIKYTCFFVQNDV